MAKIEISKALQKEGFEPVYAKGLEKVLNNIFKERDKFKEEYISHHKLDDDIAKKSDIAITKLELQKEIEEVRREVEEVRREIEVVKREIEVVRKEIAETKNDIQISINNQTKWFVGLFTAYTALIITIKFFA